MKNSKKVFEGVRFNVHSIEMAGSKGGKIRKEAVVHPGAVVVLPLLDAEHLILIRNVRFAVGETLWELPAGTLEPKEPPEETAKRELLEETGYACKEIAALTSFYTSPGYSNEIMHAFIAKDLTFKGQELEESEQIKVEMLHWNEVMRLVRNGEIRDGKTVATLLFAKFCYQQ